ncbi:GlcG/HbpS family heme-binding protein [Yersinia kristensenii]|uniref:Domain of uncharacterized function (DUF336) n=1 Tax=Yersinia kristensenii TaxID=28152 RepID=A0A0T9LRC4_YERKR|nr:heme-binding protein [Yersinia kristensenii]MDA5472492.1 heme-binding protein [Yersinia kristensenii]MDA5477192.1 heme-binding protein [Yersinia kristensenii]MDA5507637.1 heme-binding protein [Yersinia kristensenii]MDA5522240.1 heme-binding protein [Yersinia kristensenii]MDR4897095.1 heme-binding protein [Yersinia kristensenii]
MIKPIALTSALFIGLITQASAAGLNTERNISLALATDLASRTLAVCQADGYNVAVTVVDRAGIIKTVLRADNAGPHTVKASEQKAFTALSTKTPSGQVMENSQKTPAANNLKDIPGFLLLGGGVPVKAGDEVVGAVGVAGAPGGHLDAQCATKALEQISDQLKS